MRELVGEHTIGRAASDVDGEVMTSADHITGRVERARGETQPTPEALERAAKAVENA